MSGNVSHGAFLERFDFGRELLNRGNPLKRNILNLLAGDSSREFVRARLGRAAVTKSCFVARQSRINSTASRSMPPPPRDLLTLRAHESEG